MQYVSIATSHLRSVHESVCVSVHMYDGCDAVCPCTCMADVMPAVVAQRIVYYIELWASCACYKGADNAVTCSRRELPMPQRTTHAMQYSASARQGCGVRRRQPVDLIR
jgi:hypothetical protein